MLETRNEPSSLMTGKLKEFLTLFFPILLAAFSTCFFLLVEKLLLAFLSLEAMEATVNTAYASQILQSPLIVLAMMAQVYVAQLIGSKELNMVGPTIWQLIWFSCLTTLLTPLFWMYGDLYFKNSPIQEIAQPYYYALFAANFLYPLGTALSCFYLGRGKTSLIICATIIAQATKLGLAYLLIFGWKDWIPPLGIMGGAMSTFIAQGSFCLLLFVNFLKPKHATTFNTRDFRLRPKLFIDCVYPGFLRALNRILNAGSWTLTARLMNSKEDDYLLTLSIGGILFLFLPFIGDAICQAQTTVVSNILGSRRYYLLNRALHAPMWPFLFATALLSFPFLLFPMHTFNYLFPTITVDPSIIKNIFLGLWISFVFFTFSFIPLSYVLSFKDTKFSLFMGCMSWINGFLFMYLAIEKIPIRADYFWIALGVTHAINALFYFLRMQWLKKQVMESSKIQASEPNVTG
jgi:Na+-driven multidrug efflux pump